MDLGTASFTSGMPLAWERAEETEVRVSEIQGRERTTPEEQYVSSAALSR